MRTVKYIVGKPLEVGYLCAAVFDYTFNHSDFRRPFREIVSAGFVDISNKGVHCYGRSETLNVESRGKEDDAIVAQSLILDYFKRE